MRNGWETENGRPPGKPKRFLQDERTERSEASRIESREEEVAQIARRHTSGELDKLSWDWREGQVMKAND